LLSPPVADGWNHFLGAIRTGTTLAADLREVAICRVAIVNQAWYEWEHHVPLASAAGVSDQGLEVLSQNQSLFQAGHSSTASTSRVHPNASLTDAQWAVAAYTDTITRSVTVSDEEFEVLKRHFSDREIVELTATVSDFEFMRLIILFAEEGKVSSS
jgi:alkylhydroperoxidase family enzyme